MEVTSDKVMTDKVTTDGVTCRRSFEDLTMYLSCSCDLFCIIYRSLQEFLSSCQTMCFNFECLVVLE